LSTGDHWVRPLARRIIRGKPRLVGTDKVFRNFCLGVQYFANLPFKELKTDDPVEGIGSWLLLAQGYDRPNPIAAGIALMGHPSEWPTLYVDYPVKRDLQHSLQENETW